MDEEWEEEYLNSFHAKIVTLSDGKILHPHVALQQLYDGVISKQDIANQNGSEKCKYGFYLTIFPLNIASSCLPQPCRPTISYRARQRRGNRWKHHDAHWYC